MKDDPREIDWAERHIKALEEGHRSACEEIAKLGSWLSRYEAGVSHLSAQTNVDRIRLNDLTAGVASLRKQLDKLEELAKVGWANHASLADRVQEIAEDELPTAKEWQALVDRISQIENQYVTTPGFQDLIDRVRRLESQTKFETSEDDARIKALEHKASWIQEVGASFQSEMERRLNSIEGYIRQLDMSAQEAAVERPVLDEDKIPQFGAPWTDDKMVTLAQVEAGIRGYMTNHFSTATIEAVIKAALGEDKRRVAPEDNDADKPLPRRTPVDLTVGGAVSTDSPCPGDMFCWAAEKNVAHRHDRAGVVHYAV